MEVTTNLERYPHKKDALQLGILFKYTAATEVDLEAIEFAE